MKSTDDLRAVRIRLQPARPVRFGQSATTRDWVQLARSLAGPIEAVRERIQQQHRMQSELIHALADGCRTIPAGDAAGVRGRGDQLHHARPHDREAARGDGSVGWTVLIGNTNWYYAGCLPQVSAAVLDITCVRPRAIVVRLRMQSDSDERLLEAAPTRSQASLPGWCGVSAGDHQRCRRLMAVLPQYLRANSVPRRLQLIAPRSFHGSRA
jgi:hypothetical protein